MEKNIKIRILYIVDQIVSITAGSERQLSQLIANLDREKFEPELMVLRSSEWIKPEYFPCASHVLDLKSVMSLAGIKKLIELKNFIAQGNYLIVQTFFADSNVIGVLAAHQAGCKIIISSRRNTGFFYSKKLLMATKFVNKYVTRFLGNSDTAMREISKIEKIAPNRISVIYNGLDSSRFEVSDQMITEAAQKIHIEEKQKVVGIVANLRPVKDIESFIRAAGILIRSHINLRFVIIGGGDSQTQTELEKLAEELNLIDCIMFMGSIENPLAYIRNFDIGVLCSTSEGLSNTLIEYAASGIPAVATNVGGNGEVVADHKTGLLVPPKNPKKLAEAVDILLRDNDLRKKLGENARKMATEKFNLFMSVKLHQSLYTKLIDEALVSDND